MCARAFQPARLAQLGVLGVLFRRQIEDQQAIDSRRFRIAMKCLEAVPVDRIHVSVEHDGNLRLVPDLSHAIEYAMHGGPGRERACGGELVHHAIRERIGKRDAEFENIDTRLFKRNGKRARVAARFGSPAEM